MYPLHAFQLRLVQKAYLVVLPSFCLTCCEGMYRSLDPGRRLDCNIASVSAQMPEHDDAFRSFPGPPAEEDPTLDSGILEDWMLESAEGPRGCGPESEDEAGTVNYESCDEAGPRLRQAGRSFSDDSSFDLGGRRYGLKALDTDFETCAGCCIKNGKVYMDPLDFVYG